LLPRTFEVFTIRFVTLSDDDATAELQAWWHSRNRNRNAHKVNA